MGAVHLEWELDLDAFYRWDGRGNAWLTSCAQYLTLVERINAITYGSERCI